MISALKSTLNLNNLTILRPKVTKNPSNLPKKLCEPPPSTLILVLIVDYGIHGSTFHGIASLANIEGITLYLQHLDYG